MDPTANDDNLKDGDWQFPDDIGFPLVSKVLVKFYKVTDIGQDDKSSSSSKSKFLNTKVIKVEASLEKGDLLRRQTLFTALERETDFKQLCNEEAIENPKIEVSVQRKDTVEVYRVTKMKHVVARLEEIQKRQESFLVEVKEQIFTFGSKSPTISIKVNNECVTSGLIPSKGRSLAPKVVGILNPHLQNLKGSKYEKDTGRIICGKCHMKVKPRPEGAAISVLKYFKSSHFDTCGNKDKKRKAKEEEEETEAKRKKEEVDKNKKYWESLTKKKSGPPEIVSDESSDDEEIVDTDLFEDNTESTTG